MKSGCDGVEILGTFNDRKKISLDFLGHLPRMRKACLEDPPLESGPFGAGTFPREHVLAGFGSVRVRF